MSNSNVTDSTFGPSYTSDEFVPDRLIFGGLHRVTEGSYQLAANSGDLQRGTIIGAITLGTTSSAAVGGNTGNATVSAVTKTKNAQVGDYTVTHTSATAFSVTDPSGKALKNGTLGTAYNDGVGFTITAGTTPAVAGDSYTVTVGAAGGTVAPSLFTATDGSEGPVGILTQFTPNSTSPSTVGLYLTGEFNAAAVSADVSWGASQADKVTALKVALRGTMIFLKSAVSAAEPT